MAKQRLDLHGIFLEMTPNVYYQPPDGAQMKYPCIVYFLDNYDDVYADNIKYKTKKRYEVTVIDKDPESPIVDQIRELQYCRLDRHFTVDNLHHFAFTLFF